MAQHAVIEKETGKILAGHDGKMTAEQAASRAEEANKDAEKLGVEARYESVEVAAVKSLP